MLRRLFLRSSWYQRLVWRKGYKIYDKYRGAWKADREFWKLVALVGKQQKEQEHG